MAPSPVVFPPSSPTYWAQACNHLIQKDRVMRRLIPQCGDLALHPSQDVFTTLARNIVGQQASLASAQCSWDALLQLCGSMTPDQVLAVTPLALRATGLSARKTDYLVNLAQYFNSSRLHAAQWEAMDDAAVVAELLTIRGIGRRTADAFLIFHLARPNVLPLDDARLLQGISQYYFSGEAVSRSDAREVAQAWKPWCSVASWYIWQSLRMMKKAGTHEEKSV